MAWFVKQESFLWPRERLQPHLEAHRQWVRTLQGSGTRISSGYLVDGEDRPGGGGLLLLEAQDYSRALAIVANDPMVRSGGVRWQLHRWVSAAGDLAVQIEP